MKDSDRLLDECCAGCPARDVQERIRGDAALSALEIRMATEKLLRAAGRIEREACD